MSTEKIYTAAEDRLDVMTHGIGFIAALFASFILLNKGIREGGIFYTIGAILYQRKSMKYNHAIFHVFVLLGSICHYIVILNYTN